MILKNMHNRSQKWWKRWPRVALDLPFGYQGGVNLPFGLLLDPMWPHSAPPGRFVEDIGIHLGGHFDPQILDFWCWFPICFRNVFWRGFGMFLGLLGVNSWYQNDYQKEKNYSVSHNASHAKSQVVFISLNNNRNRNKLTKSRFRRCNSKYWTMLQKRFFTKSKS